MSSIVVRNIDNNNNDFHRMRFIAPDARGRPFSNVLDLRLVWFIIIIVVSLYAKRVSFNC